MKHNLVEEKKKELVVFLEKNGRRLWDGKIEAYLTELYQAGQKDMLERCIKTLENIRTFNKEGFDLWDACKDTAILDLKALSQGDK